MSINLEFHKLINNPKIKFTIILGSGFHKYALYKRDSVLSSWDLLLRALDPNVKLTEQYHLDFERIIQAKKLDSEDSYKTEKRVIQCVQKIIKDEQAIVIEECSKFYPIGIFNPKKVSDVISLNFDEIPELLLENEKGVKVGKFMNVSSFSNSSKTSYGYLSSRHKSIDFGESRTIRFWHPHGEIDEQKSIILGLHRYAHMVNTARRIRNQHLKKKRVESKDITWYNCLIDNPVIILGAGMSPTEWDMWFALTSKNRANGTKTQIFQMRECECNPDHRHEWFEPLFTGVKFKEQWEELEKLFNNIK
jgi:hypothetical protein